ncbi:hypothetical protein M9H77_11770 [Catharanthus roseus]|uniref:Uncharacterized protein n=1 Tax=Catharanthus roseus TaxID=4058 RepID=A0ACC0BFI9_CATRO|nr:hypothetical protein M9H77_11770 [Catharanthus roseus]
MKDEDKDKERLSMVEESTKSVDSHVEEEALKEERSDFMSAIPRVDEYHNNIANYASYVLGFEDKGRIMEKELGTILEDLQISLSLNPYFMWHEFSFVELELFLESYISHVSIIGDACAISFGGKVVPSTSKYVSPYDPLKNQLVINDISGEPSCFDCKLVYDDSFLDAKEPFIT